MKNPNPDPLSQVRFINHEVTDPLVFVFREPVFGFIAGIKENLLKEKVGIIVLAKMTELEKFRNKQNFQSMDLNLTTDDLKTGPEYFCGKVLLQAFARLTAAAASAAPPAEANQPPASQP